MPTRRDIFRILGSALEAGGQGLLAQQERDFDAEQARLNREIDRENLEIQRARNRLGRDELGLNRDKLALDTTVQEATIAREAQGLLRAEIGDALARGDAPEVERILSGAVGRRPAPYSGLEPEGMADVDSPWWTQLTLPRTPEAAQEIQGALASRFGIGQEGSDLRWEDIPEHAITELVRQREAASATPGLSTDPRFAGPPTAAYQTPPVPLLPSGEYLTPTTQHIRGVQEASEAARARFFRELETQPMTPFETESLAQRKRQTDAYIEMQKQFGKRVAEGDPTDPRRFLGGQGGSELQGTEPSVAVLAAFEADAAEFGMPRVITSDFDRLQRGAMGEDIEAWQGAPWKVPKDDTFASLPPSASLSPTRGLSDPFIETLSKDEVVFETQDGRLSADEARVAYINRITELLNLERLKSEAIQGDPDRYGGVGSVEYSEKLGAVHEAIAKYFAVIERATKFFEQYSNPEQAAIFNRIISQ
jgi:hypothetical protein